MRNSADSIKLKSKWWRRGPRRLRHDRRPKASGTTAQEAPQIISRCMSFSYRNYLGCSSCYICSDALSGSCYRSTIPVLSIPCLSAVPRSMSPSILGFSFLCTNPRLSQVASGVFPAGYPQIQKGASACQPDRQSQTGWLTEQLVGRGSQLLYHEWTRRESLEHGHEASLRCSRGGAPDGRLHVIYQR